jgi:E1A-binding protein p400
MPYIFRSRKEFSFWFANPMQSMIEGADTNVDIVNRLHGIIRPFVLRRLKKDVETQMPGKFEHVIKCSLSRRQLFIYEEFMARSSTRQALRKGGNFMGMMNVLMQLRKVCNHPDLFEPRSVVTPLVLDPIQISFPSCCVGVIDGAVSRDNVCDQLLVPLWKGSAGMPSFHAALRHDQIECDQLRELDASWLWQSAERRASFRGPAESIPEWPRLPLPLRELLSRLYNEERKEKESTTRFLSSLSRERCRVRPFAYPSQLIQAVNVGGISLEGKTFDILSTPSALLAALRSEQSAAEEQRDLVNRFVFCVPKASTRSPCLLSSSASKSHVEKAATELLLEPLQDIDRPFQETQSRLTSFFPDKKLVQFDAGKLQTLAALLRELKRGGHRVLIFTQMSKMLDILEAFLNLNGHTYLRLDGSTGVDRRQRLMDRFNSDDKVFCFILSTRSGGLGVNLTGADTVVRFVPSKFELSALLLTCLSSQGIL